MTEENKTGIEKQEYEPGRIAGTLESLIEFFEKDRFTPLTAFLFLVAVGAVRSVAESHIFEFERTFSMYLLIQHIGFNFPVLIMGSLVLSLASGTPLRKVYNAILPGFAIVMLPPFIDYLQGYAGMEYSGLYAYYGAEMEFIQMIGEIYPQNILFSEEVSSGLQRMVFTITSLSGLYIAVKVRLGESIKLIAEKKFKPVLKKICSIFFGVFGIWMVVWFIVAIVPTMIRIGEEGIIIFDYFATPIVGAEGVGPYYGFLLEYEYAWEQVFGYSGMAELMILQQRSLYITMSFVIISIIFMLISLHLIHKDLLKRIFSSLKLTIILPLTSSALLGSAVLHLIDSDFAQGWALDPSYVLHFPYIFYIGAMGFFLGCLGSFVADYYREEKILSKTQSKNLCIVSILAGGSFAFLTGRLRVLSIFSIAAVLVYMTFRFRRDSDMFDKISSLSFSGACVVTYFIGIYTPEIWKTKLQEGGTYSTVNITRTPELTSEILMLGAILFVLFFSLTFLTYVIDEGLLEKWFDSYLILPALIFILAFLPAIIFNEIHHLITFGLMALIAVILTDEDLSYLPISIYSLSLFYIILTLWDIIPGI